MELPKAIEVLKRERFTKEEIEKAVHMLSDEDKTTDRKFEKKFDK